METPVIEPKTVNVSVPVLSEPVLAEPAIAEVDPLTAVDPALTILSYKKAILEQLQLDCISVIARDIC